MMTVKVTNMVELEKVEVRKRDNLISQDGRMTSVLIAEKEDILFEIVGMKKTTLRKMWRLQIT